MAAEKPFLVPVVIDGTQEREAHVREPFRTAQWTRLPGGETSAALCERIKLLLAGSAPTLERESVQPDQTRTAVTRTKPRRWAAVAAIALLVAVGVVWQIVRVRLFVDMSEKKDQEYFSDGLSEELINRLSHDANLKLIARTSSFAFKGKNEDTRSIAKALGVANLLEGSVRKAGMELRVTAQLIRASDGVHLWLESYERKLTDVFKVQQDIAAAVARGLQARLLPVSLSPHAETHNIEAYSLYLQGQYFARRASDVDV